MQKHLITGLIVVVMFFLGSCKNKQQATETANHNIPANKTAGTTKPAAVILFFGNSLTAGYGLDPAESFPSLLQQKIDSANLPYKTVNAGVSGETTAGGLARIDWILRQPLDIFVLELGANDGLRGIPVSETKSNLQSIIDRVKAKYPKAKMVLAGMQMPPNMGQKYTTDFRNLFPELAKKNDMALIPFLLEGVGGVRELNQQDAIHPNTQGEKIVAENVWKVLLPVLK